MVAKYRGHHGGSALFRPVGLEIFTQVIARLVGDLSLEAAVRRASLLPRSLTEFPFCDLMWDATRGTVSSTYKVLIRNLLLDMLGEETIASRTELKEKYRRAVGSEDAELPQPVGEVEPMR